MTIRARCPDTDSATTHVRLVNVRALSGTFLAVATAIVALGLSACGPTGPGTPTNFKVVGLAPSSDPVIGGVALEGVVTLDSSPCTSDVTVQLSIENGSSAISLPSSGTVVVLADCGASQGVASFPITTQKVSALITLTIRASVQGSQDPGIKAQLTVVPAGSLKIAPDTTSVPLGATTPFTAQATSQDGSLSVDVTTLATWSSGDTSMATVSNAAGSQGVATGVAVTFQAVPIQATFEGFTATASLNVVSPALASIRVRPDPQTVHAQATVQLTATGIFTNGGTQDLSQNVIWSSSDPTIATVGNDLGTRGLVTGVKMSAQPISITATDISTGIHGSAQLTVLPDYNLGTFLTYVTIAYDGNGLANHGAQVDIIGLDQGGQFVAFNSFSRNLVTPPTTQFDVFRRDLSCVPPAQTCTPNVLESVTSSGREPNATSVLMGMSEDGSVIAFASGSPNLTSTGPQVFEITGSDPSTLRNQSVNNGGDPVDNTLCGPQCEQEAGLSATGRFVSFISTDPNLVPGNTNEQVYLHDNCLRFVGGSCTPGTTLVSASSSGAAVSTGAFAGEVGSTTLAVSADGRFATFLSDAPELGGPPNSTVLWLRDLESGTTTVASVDEHGNPLLGYSPSITADGRYLAYGATDPANGTQGVYLRDLVGGTTSLIAANATCSGHALSSDGRSVVYVTGTNPLGLANLPNGQYAYMTVTCNVPNCKPATRLVSVDSNGNPVQVVGDGAALSSDGKRVVFGIVNQGDNTTQLVVALPNFY